MNRTIGILAHVDAGKTTLSERILYETGAIRSAGRVDRGDTALDTDPIERERGITVFADQAAFAFEGQDYTLIDTPGHVDFAAEAERALDALDAAVLLLDGTGSVRPHARMLFALARERGVPVLLFVNKTDLNACDVEKTLSDARALLACEVIALPPDPERVAEVDETYLEQYLSGEGDEARLWAALKRAFHAGRAVPAVSGSALGGTGVKALLSALGRLTEAPPPGEDALDARVYKVRHDRRGTRVVFLKLLSGRLKPRDAFRFDGTVEKVLELRRYRGARYDVVDEACPGDVVGVTGLATPRCGDWLTREGVRARARYQVAPALAAEVKALDGTPDNALCAHLRMLEDEDGQLCVAFEPATRALTVRVMGDVQLEVLEERLRKRFGVRAAFSTPRVVYLETVLSPVVGYGHYEPLRHYAEVALALEPGPRGSGITFESRVHVDDLPVNYQNLIRAHALAGTHRGVLTGAALTDVKIALVAGRAHEKHTEGGDFREAVRRAIRQGLMKAPCAVLEPFYRFEIHVPEQYAGRVMADVQARSGTFSPEAVGGEAVVCGRGPVAEFWDYALKVRSFTRGEGGAVFMPDGYELCHNQDAVVEAAGYSPGADKEHSPNSVFCARGAGFTVNWDEAESHMHCLRR